MDGQKKIEILKYLYGSIQYSFAKVIMKSKITILVVNTVQVNTPGEKNLSAVVIFNQKLKIRFRSGMMFSLWWRQFDSLGRI